MRDRAEAAQLVPEADTARDQQGATPGRDLKLDGGDLTKNNGAPALANSDRCSRSSPTPGRVPASLVSVAKRKIALKHGHFYDFSHTRFA